jgi:hypothetical protein
MGDHIFPNHTLSLLYSLEDETDPRLTQHLLAFFALMSLIKPFLQLVLFELDAFTNWRHYKYLGFKASRIECG